MGKDFSIEYAHIYTNNRVAEEHKTSLGILRSLKMKLEGSSLSLVVMVDDYSFPDLSFDYDQFSEWLGEHGLMPDLLFRESQLVPVCDQVVSLLEDDKLRREITDYIKTKKYPCSLFIAAWYLVRLGHIPFASYPADLIAKKLINILPESFKSCEEKGL